MLTTAVTTISESLSVPSRYVLAVLLVAIATIVRFLILPVEVGAQFVTFYPAIMIAFYLAGNGPGMAAVALSALSALYFFFPPYNTFTTTYDIASWLIAFVVSANVCGYFVVLSHRYRKSLFEAQDQSKERELEKAAQTLALAIDGGRLGVWRFHPADNTITISETFARQFGLPTDSRSLAYEKLLGIMDPRDRESGDKVFKTSLEKTSDFELEHRVIWPDGSTHWVYVHGRPTFAADGSLEQLDGVSMDITARKTAEENYRSSVATIRAAFASMDEGILIADTQGSIIDVNWGFAPFLRISDPGKTPRTYAEIREFLDIFMADGQILSERQHPFNLALSGKKGTKELKFRRKDTGDTWYGLVGFAPILNDDNEVAGVVLTGQEITDRVLAKERLEAEVKQRTAELTKANKALLELSRHDILTGLHNRLAGNERLRSEFARMKRTGQPYGLLAIDIDFFKSVNDNFGHAIGDEVLKLVGKTLSANLRASDFLARWGGEEFFVLLPGLDQEQSCLAAEKLRAAIEATPDPVAGRLTVSIGVAVASPDDVDADIAVLKADEGLYEAKDGGRNRVLAKASLATPPVYLLGS